VEALNKREFDIEEIYAFEDHLGRLYPANQNVKPKIRQQLQRLRDQNYLEFIGRGRYRLR
jgi:type II restriction enzyme